MSHVLMLRMEPNFVRIPVKQAMYCERCQDINNSSNDRCGRCGSDDIVKVVIPAGGPPDGPDSGPAPALCVPPLRPFELLRRAA